MFIPGERVDVGFGGGEYGVQVTPDICNWCGYVQNGHNYDKNKDLTATQYLKCWELQFIPNTHILFSIDAIGADGQCNHWRQAKTA